MAGLVGSRNRPVGPDTKHKLDYETKKLKAIIRNVIREELTKNKSDIKDLIIKEVYQQVRRTKRSSKPDNSLPERKGKSTIEVRTVKTYW